MEIFIDESGSFTSVKNQPNAWSIVAAYVTPETEKRHYKKALFELKKRCLAGSKEIKLHQINENCYFSFLQDLGKLKGTLFAVGTDGYFNDPIFIEAHKLKHLEVIKHSINEMKYESGKEGQRILAGELRKTSSQLYTQLTCQVLLISSIIERAVIYYAQRNPNALCSFKWRIDQKEPFKKTDFENTFEKLTPVLLQAFSLMSPLMIPDDLNLSKMKSFIYKQKEMPEYLIEKKSALINGAGLNIQKILRDDIKFVDSINSEGVQVADLLTSGIRRLLKSGFYDNHKAAFLFSKLFIQNKKGLPPLHPVIFSKLDDKNIIELPTETNNLVRILMDNCRRMML